MPAKVTLTVSASALVWMATCCWLKSPVSDWLNPATAALSFDWRLSNVSAASVSWNRRRLTAIGLEALASGGAAGVFLAMSQLAAPSSRAISRSLGWSSSTSRTTIGPPPITLVSTLGRPTETRKCRTAAKVSCWNRSTPTAVRSSNVRVRLGKWRKKLTPTSRQSTLAFTFWFTAVLTCCAMRSRNR
jgi:hypothetical protein